MSHRDRWRWTVTVGACLTTVLGLALLAPQPRADQQSPAASAPAAKQETSKGFVVDIVRDVVYRDLCPGEDAKKGKNRLDLYLPHGVKDYPVLLFVHGGAWVRGDKSHRKIYSTLASSLAGHGIGTVVTNYRLSPGVKHPEHVKDVAKAFAWTRKNIEKYGGRSDQIFVSGHSAGGHLVSLLATDDTYLKAEGLSVAAIRGVVPLSGVYRIHDDQLEAGLGNDAGGKNGLTNSLKARLNLVNSVFGADVHVRKEASPLSHVRPGLPPFLIIYAERDLPMLHGMAKEFELALKGCKCNVQTLEAKDRNHMTVLFKAANEDDPVSQALRAFIQQHIPNSRTAGGVSGKQ
jgi:acetyl esterase/lipase